MAHYTLDTFYRSDAWRRLREVVINDRTGPDGYIRDEVTGQPILQRYDIILHHVIHLTEDNVNDASIALNPDNLQVVSLRTHNKLHERLGYRRREIWLVYGPPLSGKTAYVNSVLIPGDLVCDLDSVWQCVSGQPRYSKPAPLNGVVFRLRDTILDCIRTRAGHWSNAYIVGGYPLQSERERICRTYGAREIYIDTPRETCLQRLQEQPEGRDIAAWTGYIDEWFRRFTPPPVTP